MSNRLSRNVSWSPSTNIGNMSRTREEEDTDLASTSHIVRRVSFVSRSSHKERISNRQTRKAIKAIEANLEDQWNRLKEIQRALRDLIHADEFSIIERKKTLNKLIEDIGEQQKKWRGLTANSREDVLQHAKVEEMIGFKKIDKFLATLTAVRRETEDYSRPEVKFEADKHLMDFAKSLQASGLTPNELSIRIMGSLRKQWEAHLTYRTYLTERLFHDAEIVNSASKLRKVESELEGLR